LFLGSTVLIEWKRRIIILDILFSTKYRGMNGVEEMCWRRGGEEARIFQDPNPEFWS